MRDSGNEVATETEYVAFSSVTQEVVCLRRLLGVYVDDFEDRWRPRIPSTKTTKPLNWQRMPNTVTKLNTVTFVIILFARGLFSIKSK